MLALELAEPRLPAVARCDAAIDGFDAAESYVSMVTVVDVPSLTFIVSIEPNASDILSLVVLLVVVTTELR